MPTLEWIGKKAVLNHHRQVPYRLLHCDPSLSVGDPDSGNLLVQGDNLLALKALLPYYAGKVKCIYIDPPYNTGNENWVYNDAVNSPEIRRWLGKVVGAEAEDLSRHDKWLCMMYPRLCLLREFLTEDGVILASIDDTELASLIQAFDEVFGARNRLSVFTWVRKKKGSHLDKRLRKMTEFVVAYASSMAACVELFGEPAYADKWQPIVKRTNSEKTLCLEAGAIETALADGSYQPGGRGQGGTALDFLDGFRVADGRLIDPVRVQGRFVWLQKTLDQELAMGTRIALSKKFGFNVLRWNQDEKVKRPSTLLNDQSGVGTNEDASKELAAIFGAEQGVVFQFPKPVSLVRFLLKSATKNDPDALILDSFAGTGTTGNATLSLNDEDGGKRRFIMVEMDEDVCRTVAAERLKRVITGYGDTPGLGGGFRYCTLGEPLFDEAGNIRESVTFSDLAAHVFFTETGSPMPGPADGSTLLLGVHNGRAVYLLFNGVMGDKRPNGGNVLTNNVLRHLPEHPNKGGVRVVYGEGCRLGAARLKREGIVFRQVPYEVKVS
jgi:site-specific DNA-methyltransferase (adenine-specific)/adenine-specific DNA-methyltransferase